ncbi:MAG: hypothetical protein M0Z61_12700 [Nitrospiraceae bacterium]|nr:hypothetical protein [Nitrospiraceae bacterium]
MKKIYAISFSVLLVIALLSFGGCKTGRSASPQALLDRYFSSAVRQDYAGSYNCYYQAYKAKINRAEYIKRRKEDTSILKEYTILSVSQSGDTAKAKVLLAFDQAGQAKANPVDVTVTENMVKENGDWKIKVW